MADTKLSLYEMEVAIARSREFDYTKKLVVYNVIGMSSILPIHHECDVLVCSKSGYLTEIEIKRSYADFLNDFKKEHDHRSRYIKGLYYCVPTKIKDKVIEYLDAYENRDDYRVGAGVIVIDEDDLWLTEIRAPKENKGALKLSMEQTLYLARLGAMRCVGLKRKFVNMQKETKKDG